MRTNKTGVAPLDRQVSLGDSQQTINSGLKVTRKLYTNSTSTHTANYSIEKIINPLRQTKIMVSGHVIYRNDL